MVSIMSTVVLARTVIQEMAEYDLFIFSTILTSST